MAAIVISVVFCDVVWIFVRTIYLVGTISIGFRTTLQGSDEFEVWFSVGDVLPS